MASDAHIHTGLGVLGVISYRLIPIEGTWCQPPYRELLAGGRRGAVICEDPGVATLFVDRSSGEVLILASDGEPVLVNRSVEQLVACARAREGAIRAADELDPEDHDGLEALARRLHERFAALDPAAVDDENQLWAVAAEEMGYGL